jgi:hypothetical protein
MKDKEKSDETKKIKFIANPTKADLIEHVVKLLKRLGRL